VAKRDRKSPLVRQWEEICGILVKRANDGLCIAEAESGRILYANPALAAMCGYTTEEMQALTIFDLHLPEDRDRARDLFNRFVHGESVVVEFWMMNRKSGEQIYAEVKPGFIELEGKRFITNIARDITERKRMEEALRRSEERYRDLYENAPIAYNTVGIDGRIHTINARTEKMLGFDRKDLIGRPVFDLCADTPAGKVKAKEIFQRFLAGEDPGDEEVEMRAADGRSVWISLTVRSIRNAQGDIVESRSMLMDITERKRMEEALEKARDELERRVEERTAELARTNVILREQIAERQQAEEAQAAQLAAMEAATDGIAILDRSGTFIYMNQAHAKIYGHDGPEELVGKTWRVLYGEDEIDRFEREFLPTLSERGRWQGEVIGKRRDGSFFDVEVSLTTLEGGGVICVCRDITERRRVQNALARTAQLAAIGQMTAQVTHEIKNPLTSLKLYAHHLQSVLETGSESKEIAHKIAATLDDLESTVAEIVGAARPVKLQPEPVQMNELLRETMGLVIEQSRSKGVTITERLAPDLPAGNFDRRQLKKVFLNLLLNALDASSPGSEIEVMSSYETDCPIDQGVRKLAEGQGVLLSIFPFQPGERAKIIHVWVVDHGRGMDQATLDRIMEPFFTTKPSGLGLGLVTAKTIIDQHRGLLHITSEPGVGTTAMVCLKVSEQWTVNSGQ
jgi:PAS domain S-box-containing protein